MTSRRASRRLAAPLAVLPLVAAGIATVPGAVSGAASAACAPGIATVAHHAKPGHTRTAASSVSMTKRHKHAHVASATLTITSGSASVTIAQTVCPDGADGAAASTTQSATGRGITTKVVKAKGASARAARKALTSALAEAKRAAKEAAATKKGERKAKKRALAAAKAAALPKAHLALYASDVVYLTVDSAGTYHVTAAVPAGAITVTKGASGEIVLNVPAGYQPKRTSPSPCFHRAPAWPTSFLFDGGTLVSPLLEEAAHAETTAEYGISAVPMGNVDGLPLTTPQANQGWSAYWKRAADGTVGYNAGLSPSDTAYAGAMECVQPMYAVSTVAPAGYTATLVGAHVGTSLVRVSNAFAAVPGGIPVELR